MQVKQKIMVPITKYTGRLGNQMFQHAYLYAQMRKGVIPDIYLQDEKYFKEYAHEIRQMYGVGRTNLDQVSIHVRRGDYVNNKFYVDLTKTDYYIRAMEQFPDSEFLVFSDDIEWCKNERIFEGCEFSEGKSEVEDMTLMSSCKGHIIANSSFSWWAAYISGNKTVAPKQWHPDGVERTIIPNQWIQI